MNNAIVRYGYGEHGQPRQNILLCLDGGKLVASAARIAGTEDSWVVVDASTPPRSVHRNETGYHTEASEAAAREALFTIAGEADA